MGTTVNASDPTVRVFKNGYEPLVVIRAGARDNSHAKSLGMRRFEGTAAEYASLMDPFWIPLDVNLHGPRCDLRAAPRLFNALVQLRGEFDSVGVRTSLPLQSGWCSGEMTVDGVAVRTQ